MSSEGGTPYRDDSPSEPDKLHSRDERDTSSDPAQPNRENIHDLRISQIELELQNEVLKNIRLELERTRNLNQKMIRALPIAFFTLNRYNLIEEVNQAGGRILGIPVEKLIKRKFTEVIESADIDRFYRHRRDALRLNETRTCRIHLISTLRPYPVPVELTCLNLGNGRLQIALLELLAEGRRLSDLDFQSMLLDNVVEAVIATDSSGVILYWGKGAEKKLGWQADDVIGKNIHDVLNVRLDDVNNQADMKELMLRKDWYIEIPFKRPDQREILLSLHLTAVKGQDDRVSTFIGVGRDITRSKRTEHDLRIMQASIHSSINGIYITDLKGTITYVNRSLVRLLGYSEDSEIIGKKASDIIENRQRYRRISRLLEKNGEWQGEIALKSRNGDHIDVLLSANTVTGDDCQPFCTMGSFIDISQRKKMEAELTQYREQLENLIVQRTRELEAANQELERRIMTSTKAEDRIRNLSKRLVEAREKEVRRIGGDLHDMVGSSLTVLKLAIHEIRKRLPESEKELLSHIDEITTDLAQQVRALSHSLRPTDLEKMGLIESLMAYFAYVEHQTGMEILFEYNLQEERFAENIEITVYRIAQEAINNAAKYAGVNNIRVSLYQDNTELHLIIEDTGKGFDIDNLPPETSGILGMYDRAILAGGKLDIYSGPDKGTKISCTVPTA